MSLAQFESSFEVPFKVQMVLKSGLAPCTSIPEEWWGYSNRRDFAPKTLALEDVLDRFQAWYDQHIEYFQKRGGRSEIDRWFVGEPYLVKGINSGLIVDFYHQLGGFPFKQSSFSFLCVEPGMFAFRWGAPGSD